MGTPGCQRFHHIKLLPSQHATSRVAAAEEESNGEGTLSFNSLELKVTHCHFPFLGHWPELAHGPTFLQEYWEIFQCTHNREEKLI